MQIQQTKSGGVIVYEQDDFIGLVPGYASTLYPKIGRGASWLHGINPFLFGPGVLCPGLLGTALTNNSSIAATINNACVERTASAASAWLIEAGAKIHQIANLSTPYTISTTSPFPYTIGTGVDNHDAHSTFVGEDILTFNISGTEYVFFSFNDNTDGDVGRVSLPSTFDDDWFSTATGGAVLDKDVPHPMIVGDDQKLYIADRLITSGANQAKLWSVSDTGTIASSLTIIPRNYVIRAFAKSGDHLVIFANKIKASASAVTSRGDAVAFFWDYSASSADFKYSLNDNEVTAGFILGGAIGCFTQGRINEFANVGYNSKLQIFEGGRFTPKFNFSQIAPGYGGVEIVNNMLIWNSGGVVYSYGSPYPELPARINKINIGVGTSNGFVKALNGIEIYMSTGSGTSNEVFKQAETYFATSDWRGLTAEPLFPLYTEGMVDYIEIGFYGSASGGRTMTFSLDFDYGTSTKTVLSALATVTAGTQILYRDKDTSGAAFPVFKALKPIVTWAAGAAATAAPKISYIKIFYSHQPLKT